MLKAIILDFNGVIISDEEYHNESWREMAKKLGKNIPEKTMREKVFNKREKEAFTFILNKKLTNREVAELSKERNNIVYSRQGKISPVKGLKDFLKKVKNEKILLGLATNSRKAYLTHVLREFGVSDEFDVKITAEDVKVGKPEPDIYTLTAKKLGVRTKNCLVIEDTPTGITSAKRAEMKVIAFTTSIKDREKLKKADKIVKNFEDLRLSECKKMF